MKLPERTRDFRDRLCLHYLARSRGILHLGAHLGQEAALYYRLGKPVIWIEAIPDIHARLEERLRDFPNQRALCALLGDADGVSRSFHISSNSEGVSSSLFEFGPRAEGERSLWPDLKLHMVREISLQMTRLDTLLGWNRINPSHYNYWIVDLQGAEKLALQGASVALRECLAVYVEVSRGEVYREGVLWPDLRTFLADAGFIPLWEPALDHDDVLFVRAAQLHDVRRQFQSEHYQRHNLRRLEHLASLRLDLDGKSVLEVGAGIGDHTGFYLERGCKVTVTDVRPENLAVLSERFGAHPDVDIRWLDMDCPGDLPQQFEVIHCYGILYHLERPAEALDFLARHCRSLLVIETCVSAGSGLSVNPVAEPAEQYSQAFYGKGCRPTRSWVWARLMERMPYVYSTRCQPDHEEFPLCWSDESTEVDQRLRRAVFVSSQSDLSANPNLLSVLPALQSKYQARNEPSRER